VLSPFTFPVVIGQTYQISLDGVNGSYGAATINFSFAPLPPPPPPSSVPANDSFVQRTFLVGGNIATNGTTLGATLELTDPDLGYGLDARTVWYSWTARASGTTFIETDPNQFPTYVSAQFGVYAGSTPGSLIPITMGSDYNGANFYALAGTAYQIEVATPAKARRVLPCLSTAPRRP
jgi:hypothetical protein